MEVRVLGTKVSASTGTRVDVDAFVVLGDTTPPTVSSVSPEDGATGVPFATSVEATFSEAMDESTLTNSAFTLVKEGATTPVEARVSYDPQTRKATLDPKQTWRPGSSTRRRSRAGRKVSGTRLAIRWRRTRSGHSPPLRRQPTPSRQRPP